MQFFTDPVWPCLAVFLGSFDALVLCRFLPVSDGMSCPLAGVSSEKLKQLSKSLPRRELLDLLVSTLLTKSPTDCCVNGDSLLHWFARRGDLQLVRIVLALEDTRCIGMVGAGEMSALHCGAFGRSKGVCEALLAKGANSDSRDALNRRPEDWASIQGEHELATLLRRSRKSKKY